MTQSKKNNDTITIDVGDYTIDLNNTYGTTTTYWDGNTMTDSVTIGSSDTTIDLGKYTLSGDFGDMQVDQSWQAIYPSEVESMCKEYPSLEKVWRNFKSVYDMVKQDYEGKKQAGEIDEFNDDIPF